VLFNATTLHTLFVANDNDFVPGIAGDSKFFVFGVSDADLTAAGASFTPQQFVPEPATLALFGLGLFGIAVTRKRRHKRLTCTSSPFGSRASLGHPRLRRAFDFALRTPACNHPYSTVTSSVKVASMR
jgi:hypothetical protein